MQNVNVKLNQLMIFAKLLTFLSGIKSNKEIS